MSSTRAHGLWTHGELNHVNSNGGRPQEAFASSVAFSAVWFVSGTSTPAQRYVPSPKSTRTEMRTVTATAGGDNTGRATSRSRTAIAQILRATLHLRDSTRLDKTSECLTRI